MRPPGRGRTRLRALFLAVVFLAAGTSLPGLDALLYHLRGTEAASHTPHLEAAGGCHGHAGHCTLGGSLPTATTHEGPASHFRTVACGHPEPGPIAATAPRSRAPVTPRQPRAPPTASHA